MLRGFKNPLFFISYLYEKNYQDNLELIKSRIIDMKIV